MTILSKKTFTKILRIISILVLSTFLLSIYSNLVFKAAKDGKYSSFIAHHLTNFANYPNLVYEVFKSNELAGIPPSYIKIDTSFHETNKLSYNLFALNSFWDTNNETWDIKLLNLKNDSLIFKWTIPRASLDLSTTNYHIEYIEPRSSIILPHKSLIVAPNLSANLMRLDSNSQVVWVNHSLIFHHSLNLDADSNIWACSSLLMKNDNINMNAVKQNLGVHKYKEDYITKVDKNTGEILFHKGLSEIFIDNHYKNYAYGFYNGPENDPIHINDIEPALTDSEHWKKGDLFISCRHRSVVILYRPSTNKIIKLIFGEFINQHDVDIVSNNEIFVFNNNYINADSIGTLYTTNDTLISSEIAAYNFKNDSFRKHLNQHFVNEKIWTRTQGLYTVLSNGDVFVESQNQGRLFVINDKGVVLKKMIHSPIKGYAYYPNWIRIYEKLPF